jgi:tyrosinase
MSQPVIVTGITTGFQPQAPVSQLPPRLEWQTFVQNLDFVTLYVKALQQFMNLTQSEVTSYFQIGGSKSFFIPLTIGIHGLPYTPWNGVNGVPNPSSGYCNHGSPSSFYVH